MLNNRRDFLVTKINYIEKPIFDKGLYNIMQKNFIYALKNGVIIFLQNFVVDRR